VNVPLPHGQRCFVVSDLDLAQSPEREPSVLEDLVRFLNDVDDAAVLVIAGNLFDPNPDDGADFVEATLAAHPALADALGRFAAGAFRRLVVLGGSRDRALLERDDVREVLGAHGAEVARDVVVQVATAHGTRDLAVAVGEVRREPADAARDVERLEDPAAAERFAASQLLYRRLARWVWFPMWALVALDVAGSVVTLAGRVTHHRWHLHRTHPQDVWSSLLVNLLVLAAFEALLALAAGWAVRRRFRRRTPGVLEAPGEPLAATSVDGVDAIEYARRVAERGGAGAVVGGSPQAALAFLDAGVCAAPGPSRTVVVERRGRLGLPPVFTEVERLGIVEVEAASSVRVRLVGEQRPGPVATRLERWVAGPSVQPALADSLGPVGAWPTGEPWPQAVDSLAAQRRQRAVRRLASGLLLVTGLADVGVAAAPPLRERLHAVLSILPIGVVQSATAVTAIAGFAMIMMARGVRRGQRRAWVVAVAMLAVSVASHLIRGGSARGSLLAVGVLGVLAVGRRHFAATTDREGLATVLPRLGAAGVVAVVAATVGIEFTDLAHRSLPAWPKVLAACVERLVGVSSIALPDRVADFVNPALLTVGVALIATALYFVSRPVVDRRLSERGTGAERRLAELRARDLVRRHGRGTLDYFALRDDKQFFFHRDSLVAYAVYGGVALISPDPIGPAAERVEVFSAFRAFAEGHGWTLGVMAASEQWLPIYQAAGLHSIYLGDEAVVDCSRFSLAGGKMKGLRQACTRVASHGYRVEFVDPADIDPSEVTALVELTSMLRRGEGERGFSMMLGRLFDPRDQGLLLAIVRGPSGVPAALCQFVPSPAIGGYSLDLMRRDPGEHPNGLLDFALCSTIQYLAERGGGGLSMNFAAFRSVLDGERGEGTFTRVERWALRRLSGVLPIESLWSFNAKYDPAWLPRYLVYPAAESFVPVVAAILRAESITELPVIGRLLANDPANRPGTVVPAEVLERARHADARR
jgi:lysylphosphatidylglycerol synthetase-like protein (DUF2156 family)